MTKIKDVRYKWSKLFAAKNFGGKDCILEPIEQQELLDDLDTAASAIEKVHYEEMEDFIEWVGNNYVKLHKVWVHRYASQTNPENFVTYAQLRAIFLRQEKIRTDFINSSR